MTETILVIDDDADLRGLVSLALSESGYRVVEAADGPAGISAYHGHQPDLIVLDIGLGAMDGLEVCRQLRAVGTTPIVFLTSRAEEVDQLVGFAAGADDYVTKPFSPRLLVARVGSVLRRGSGAEEEKTRFEVGPLTVDTESRTATVNDVELDLTRTEFDLLTILMENPRRVITRDMLLERVWGSWYGDDHVVEVHMSRLRSKVKAAGGLRIGVAVRGVGYKLGVDSDA
ncbi:MAG: response regulator transcription factor [Actinobacteria bacterium]|jgi:DNA-binding response OmpR family regulator|nr:response regulator transcription factor [Actinomycetota bacterium]